MASVGSLKFYGPQDIRIDQDTADNCAIKDDNYLCTSYCRLARMQIRAGQKEAALETLRVARLYAHSEELMNYERVDKLIEIARSRLVINPGVLTKVLINATKYEEEEFENDNKPQKAAFCLPTHVSPLCRLAELYYQSGKLKKADEFIQLAAKCSSMETPLWEGVKHAISIARIQLLLGKIKQAHIKIDQALSDVAELKKSEVKINCWCSIAKLVMPTDSKKARDIILLAEQEVLVFNNQEHVQAFWKNHIAKLLAECDKQVQEFIPQESDLKSGG